ncbi:MAG: hypothetical protein Q9195_008138 [Heterodermia aff. obscurata]
MADSDSDYVQDASEGETSRQQVTRGVKPVRVGPDQSKKWEVARPWDDVREDASGAIAVDDMLEAGKRKSCFRYIHHADLVDSLIRFHGVSINSSLADMASNPSLPDRKLKDTTPLQRGIIRHLILVIDCSTAMLETDMRPTRYLLTIRYAQAFVLEFFEQNPISQLGIIGMRDGLAQRISDTSGNPSDHIARLQSIREQEPKGQASLQNALVMSRAALFHAPTHTTREVLLLYGSLLSSDPGDIHQTITALANDHITCVVIGLAAQIAICRTLVSRTNPSMPASESYTVALDDIHYRELIMRATTPPPTASSSSTTQQQSDVIGGSTLLSMGFPSRITDRLPSLCACHSRPTSGGYLCSRCSAKICALPSKCPCCGLTLILSTHLARSYHHLFPLRNWKEVSWQAAAQQPDAVACFSCLAMFPPVPHRRADSGVEAAGASGRVKEQGRVKVVKRRDIGVSESGRYECETCHTFFCIDCDVFCHDVVHNCPGCQCREEDLMPADGGGNGDGAGAGLDGAD